MNPGNFFAELKRRNVYKVAVAYAVVAWLVIQAASIFFPTFNAPQWAMQVVILVLVVGFPIALAFSWAFEITPEGIVRESDVAADRSITHHTGRKIVAVTAVLAVIAAGLFVFQLVRSKSQETLRQGASAARTEGATVSSKSIAVLPFDNLSHDPDNAYFCEGVQDEILTRLAKVADLKVISRTSTQHFKSTPDNLPQIAQQLGVANILEGSVQKANDQVRVNVQLINAQNDTHLWADTYDRKLTDIFAVESEIAKTIAETLQARLSGSEKNSIAKAPTANPEAYELYLKGRFFWNKRNGDDLRKAIDYFNQTIAKDPNYALAYVGVADSYLLLPSYGAVSPVDSLPEARAALKKALALDDSMPEAHASFGLLDTVELNLQSSIGELKRAVELNPNYATAHHWLALALMTVGQFDPGIAQARRALELDPLSLIINSDFSWLYLCSRRYDEAAAQARKALEIDPNFFLAHYYLGEILQFRGRLTDAIAEYQRAFDLTNDPYPLAALGQARARNGQKDEARKILARLHEEAKSRFVAPYAIALVLTGLGEKTQAIDELERAFREGTGAYLFVIKVDPFLDDLRGDPRFEALVQKIVAPNEAQ
jgi:TolB-like protein/Flp pilus assembly protein TadD